MSIEQFSSPSTLDRTEAIERLAAVQREIDVLVAYIQDICDHHNLSHSIDIAYGMGGTYTNGSWESSSQNC